MAELNRCGEGGMRVRAGRWSLGAFMALGMLVVGCQKAAPPEEPVRAVKLVTATATTLGAAEDYAGEVRARVESRLGFRVGGKMLRRLVEPGQTVQAGQLLAQLDPKDYQLAADAARAQVGAALTQRDLAALELRRFQALKEQGFISGAEIDRRSAQLKAAQATLDQAQAQLATLGNQAGYANLLADASGVITGVDAEPGQVVAAGASVVRLARDGARDVVFAVPEDRVRSVRVGQPVRVRAWAGAGELQGSVREVAASADPATRTFTVKVALAGTPPPLGSTVHLGLVEQGGAAPVIKLPTSALRQDGAGSAVWVYDPASGTVRSQPVTVATVDGNDAVIATGVTPGMRIVSAGVHVLAPGQKVTVYKEKTDAAGVNAGSGATSSEAHAGVNPAPGASGAAAAN